MHPAKSVIFFTTTTGAGYGLLISLFAYAMLGDPPTDSRFFLFSFAAAFGLVVAGLAASTFHLGHPERAWRALSQWRSSWLSREGVAAILTFIPAVGFAASWWYLGQQAFETAILGAVTTIFSLATIWCTGMIYASLKAIPAWNNPWTVPGYLSLAAATGVPLFLVLGVLFDADIGRLAYITAIAFIAFAFAVKSFYWMFIKYGETTSSATVKAPAMRVGVPHRRTAFRRFERSGCGGLETGARARGLFADAGTGLQPREPLFTAAAPEN